MKYIIFSDVQGNYEAIKVFNRGITGFHKDRIICLGDIIGNGTDFQENITIDLIRNLPDLLIVQGNHEKNTTEKISPENKKFLSRLPRFIKEKHLIGFHSSLEHPNKRLKTIEDLTKEASFLTNRFQSIKFFVFGHTHLPGVYEIDSPKLKVQEIKGNEISLKPDKKYLINPGGLGLYYNLPQTFAILDEESKKLEFMNLKELETMDIKKRALNLFEEIAGYLTGDEFSLTNLKKQSTELEQINKYGILDNVIRTMKKLDYRNNSNKKGFYKDYSLKLAENMQELLTDNIVSNYSVQNPLNLMRRYLRLD